MFARILSVINNYPANDIFT